MTRLAPAAPPRVPGDPPPATPWALGDVGRLIRYQGAGFVAIVVCYVGADQTKAWNSQLYWIVGAMAGMLVAGASWVMWLLVAARGVRQRQRRLERVTAQLAAVRRAGVTDDVLVTGAGMTHFHRASCVFVEGRRVTEAPAARHTARGLTPCKVCLG